MDVSVTPFPSTNHENQFIQFMYYVKRFIIIKASDF